MRRIEILAPLGVTKSTPDLISDLESDSAAELFATYVPNGEIDDLEIYIPLETIPTLDLDSDFRTKIQDLEDGKLDPERRYKELHYELIKSSLHAILNHDKLDNNGVPHQGEKLTNAEALDIIQRLITAPDLDAMKGILRNSSLFNEIQVGDPRLDNHINSILNPTLGVLAQLSPVTIPEFLQKFTDAYSSNDGNPITQVNGIKDVRSLEAEMQVQESLLDSLNLQIQAIQGQREYLKTAFVKVNTSQYAAIFGKEDILESSAQDKLKRTIQIVGGNGNHVTGSRSRIFDNVPLQMLVSYNTASKIFDNVNITDKDRIKGEYFDIEATKPQKEVIEQMKDLKQSHKVKMTEFRELQYNNKIADSISIKNRLAQTHSTILSVAEQRDNEDAKSEKKYEKLADYSNKLLSLMVGVLMASFLFMAIVPGVDLSLPVFENVARYSLGLATVGVISVGTIAATHKGFDFLKDNAKIAIKKKLDEPLKKKLFKDFIGGVVDLFNSLSADDQNTYFPNRNGQNIKEYLEQEFHNAGSYNKYGYEFDYDKFINNLGQDNSNKDILSQMIKGKKTIQEINQPVTPPSRSFAANRVQQSNISRGAARS